MVRSPPLRNSKGQFVKKKDKIAESEKSEEITETADPPTTAMDAAAFMEAVDRIIRENREAAERTTRENREAAQEDRRMFLKMVKRTRQPAAEAAPTLKPSEIYLFKPTNRQDDKSARIFIERIIDAQKTYRDHIAKLAILLSRCLDNEVAHTWYSALSTGDKDSLLQSSNHWISTFKQDFMGTDAQLRFSADKKSFHWNQGRSPAEYVDEKVGKLRVAGMEKEKDIIMRVYKGFHRVLELQLSLAMVNRSTLQQFRDYLREIQDNHRLLHEKRTFKAKENRYDFRL